MILGIAIAIAVAAFIVLFFVMRNLINLEEPAAAEPLPAAASDVAPAPVR